MTQANAALVQVNVKWLRQALELLGSMDDASFGTPPAGWACRAASQLRHVIEFYECFLDGLATGHIDYDARRRDLSVEASCAAAGTRIRSLIARLESEFSFTFDHVVFVRAEDADALGLQDPFLVSSVSRELLALSSHTVHHFALIAMTVRAHGVAVDPDFGVAPSTLRSRERARSLSAGKAA